MNETAREALLAFAATMLVFAVIVGVTVAGVWHYEHVACLRLSEQTVYPTRMAGNAFGGGCYVKINGRWIPAERYRSVDLDGAA